MGLIGKLFGGQATAPTRRLYDAVVGVARTPHWYLNGAVPDTIDGRFDMIAVVLSIVLLRLEQDPAAAAASARLTEHFIEDMDAQLRQVGIGDVGIGKHVGKMMSMLGGRLGAYRDALAAGAPDGALADALVRNLYRGDAPDAASLAYVAAELRRFEADVAATPIATLIAGSLR